MESSRDWEELDEGRREDYPDRLRELPDDTAIAFTPDERAIDYFSYLSDELIYLEDVSKTLPNLEIAMTAFLNYSMCRNALYTFYSPAGKAEIFNKAISEDWFSTDDADAAWENYEDFIEETGCPDEIQTTCPKNLEWFRLEDIVLKGLDDGEEF